jgi:predicted nuclease of predicted toxin-antitoxin system
VKLLIDMNLSPLWAAELRQQGWEAVHWSTIGDPRPSDRTILGWAQRNGYVVFTHDLDFGALLAATRGLIKPVLKT